MDNDDVNFKHKSKRKIKIGRRKKNALVSSSTTTTIATSIRTPRRCNTQFVIRL